MPDIQSVVTWWAVDRMDLFVIPVAGICFSRIFHRHAPMKTSGDMIGNMPTGLPIFFFLGGAFPKVSLPRCQQKI
jgi:hypothetical protein